MSVNPILGEQQIDELVREFWPVQPEPGSVADQLLRQGEARGEVLGEARGLTAGIRALQEILGVPVATETQLTQRSVEELRTELESLQLQIARRQK